LVPEDETINGASSFVYRMVFSEDLGTIEDGEIIDYNDEGEKTGKITYYGKGKDLEFVLLWRDVKVIDEVEIKPTTIYGNPGLIFIGTDYGLGWSSIHFFSKDDSYVSYENVGLDMDDDTTLSCKQYFKNVKYNEISRVF